jgi:HK97 family phage major capsid protein
MVLMETDLGPEITKMGKELKDFTTDVKKSVEKLDHESKVTSDRLLGIEQNLTSRLHGGGFGGFDDGSDIGLTIANSDGFKRLQAGEKSTGLIKVGSFSQKSTVVSGTWSSQPERVPGVVVGAQRRLTVRDLLPTVPTGASSVEFAKENVVTNAADYQVAQGDAKPESAITYTLVTAPVATLAHFLPASRQLLEDSAAFSSYINNRLTYLLHLKEESELLFGTGASGHLSGLVTQASTMSTTNINIATDSYIDVVGEAIQQLGDSDFEADAVVLNARDWWAIRKLKTSGSGADGRYIVGDPLQDLTPTLWGLPVVPTNSMTQGQFLVGAFRAGAAIYDRQAATVEVSREHSDYFVRNLAALLCEERLALVVYRASAFLFGGFPYGS